MGLIEHATKVIPDNFPFLSGAQRDKISRFSDLLCTRPPKFPLSITSLRGHRLRMLLQAWNQIDALHPTAQTPWEASVRAATSITTGYINEYLDPEESWDNAYKEELMGRNLSGWVIYLARKATILHSIRITPPNTPITITSNRQAPDIFCTTYVTKTPETNVASHCTEPLPQLGLNEDEKVVNYLIFREPAVISYSTSTSDHHAVIPAGLLTDKSVLRKAAEAGVRSRFSG